jgi:hypothetical protein
LVLIVFVIATVLVHNKYILSEREEEAEEVGHLGIHHCHCLSVRDSEYLRPLGEVAHGNQEVSVPAVALREGACYVDGNPLEWCPNIVLVHQALAPGSLARCVPVTLLTPSLDVAS